MNVAQFVDKTTRAVQAAGDEPCPECGESVATSLTRYIDPTGEYLSSAHIHVICMWCEWSMDQTITAKLDLDGSIDESKP